MKIDFISDVHLDRVFSFDPKKNKEQIKEYVRKILPEHPSNTLVFAGDFGEYNIQNYYFLTYLKEHYHHIFYTYGNNDLTIPRDDRNYEEFTSVLHRVNDFEQRVKHLDGVYRLDGTFIELNGVVFGGCDLFFDFDVLKERFHLSDQDIQELWKEKRMHVKHRGVMDEPAKYIEEQKNKLRSIIEKSDVIITHGPPNYFIDESDCDLGFFNFEASEFTAKIAGKLWNFGHKHERSHGEKYGCEFINAAALQEFDTAKVVQIKK